MHKEYRFRSIKCQRYFTVNENGATSELSVRSSLSFLLGMSMPELWIDPWSISWLWEKSCISLSVTYQTQIGLWCRVFRFVLILMLYSHISRINAFIYSFVSWKKWEVSHKAGKMDFPPLWEAAATVVRMALYWDVNGPCWVPLRWQCLRSAGAGAGVQAPCVHFYPQGFALTSPCS